MQIFVKPVNGFKVYLSELQGPVPPAGLYVTKSKEVYGYIADGFLAEKENKKGSKK